MRSQAGSKDPVPFQRTNRTIVTPAVQLPEAPPIDLTSEPSKAGAVVLTRQSGQALLRDTPADPAAIEPVDSDTADPHPTHSHDANDSSRSGWGRKRPRGFRP